MKPTTANVDTCDYCGLPLAARAGPGNDLAAGEPEYCCFGCRFAAAVAGAGGETGQARSLLTRLGIAIFFTMNVMMFALTLWTEDVYGGTRFMDQSQAIVLHQVFRYVCLLSTLPVLLLLGGPLAENVLSQPRLLPRSTDTLLLLGVSAAFAYSMLSVLRGSGHIYFEVCCVVLVAVTLGRWFEATGKLQTTAALRSLEALVPDQVRIVTSAPDSSSQERWIPTVEVQVGDEVLVLAGERIPVDGTVTVGTAAVDQQLITGESDPAGVSPGDFVYAGSLNLDGRLQVRAVAPSGSAAIDEIVTAVTAAAATKERYGRIADRVSRIFLPVVVCVALITAGYWIVRGQPSIGILRGLAVVVISCPCALALATPMAIWSCYGRAAKSGVIIRRADILDQLRQVTKVCVDKTGTLTTGRVTLSQVICTAGITIDNPWLQQIGVELAQSTNHPMAQAVLSAFPSCSSRLTLHDLRSVAGRGVVAHWSHVTDPVLAAAPAQGVAYLGNFRWMEEHQQQLTPELAQAIEQSQAQGQSITLLAWSGHVQAAFIADEEIRPSTTTMLVFFAGRGIPVHLLTGDHGLRAARLASELRIEADGDLLPSEKARKIAEWQAAGHHVLMIGDGVNDAPALAVADISLAMGCGAEISRHTSDICLLSNDLSQIPLLFQLAADTIATIRWNLIWAFAYNTLALPLALIGWVNPIVAAIAMVVSSLMVVGNSLRLARDETHHNQSTDLNENGSSDEPQDLTLAGTHPAGKLVA